MDNDKRETTCSKCIHSDVCVHKQDFIDMNKAIFNATVSRSCENDDGGTSLKRVTAFECFGGISISCRFFTNKCVVKRGVMMNEDHLA